MIEIKPIKLHNSPTIIAKREAAECYCQEHDMIYQLIDPPISEPDIILELMASGTLKFYGKYEQKIKDYFRC